MAQEQPKLRGAVREVGLSRDGDRFDNFTVTIGIQIRTEGRVTYDEAEKLATRYRREYLGKEVEFLSVNLPCPVCGKVLNSEVGLKGHIRQSHPERLDLLKEEKPEPKARKEKPKKAAAKKPEKKTRKTRKTAKKTPKKAAAKEAKAVKAPAPKATKAAAKKAEKPRAAKAEPSKAKASEAKKAPAKKAEAKPEVKPAKKPARKINGRQTRLA